MQQATPEEAVVAVLSKGDPRLLELEARRGVHFPADAEGRYAGFHPRNSEEAIAQLEAARSAGAEYLCLPATGFWWLEHYDGLAAWLGTNCATVADDPATCIVYDLLEPPAVAPLEAAADADRGLRDLLEALLPERALLFAIGTDGTGLGRPGWTIAPLGRGNVAGLRRRLRSAAPPAFVLVARGPSDPIPGDDLERALADLTRPVARRPGLCDLHEVRDGTGASGPARPAAGEVRRAVPTPNFDDAEADKLMRRLERLGTRGDDWRPSGLD
ncbi:MAG: hypothetical protein JSU06_04745 [Actinobacteria bacterium]|nr:hypothetical protein [Actinomycetota bacterium]